MWQSSEQTTDEKVEEGWPIVVALAEEVAQAHTRRDDLAELLALRRLLQFAQDVTEEAVSSARAQGMSWATIGAALGVATQTAHQRYRDADAHISRYRRTPRRWWKLNIHADHLVACQSQLKFGTERLLTWRPCDILLLQLKKDGRPDPHARIAGALVYDTFHVDKDGESVGLWGERFSYVLDASKFLPTKPFSLEDVPGLRGVYSRQGQMNHQRILAEDVRAVATAAGLQHLADPGD